MGELPEFFATSTKKWFETSLGTPTAVQVEAWPEIAKGKDTLVSAPTGTGKTLTAFLVFIDQMMKEVVTGTLKEELQLIYVSPLKSLAADIRENLKRPLDGIYHEEMTEHPELMNLIRVAIRTGDTTQSERQKMIKHPPHILITMPESLYLLLTSKSGRGLLATAHSIILDELHAVIDTKRGAHLMLSLARLDVLCEKPLQRIGLSATIEPLSVAAQYLSPGEVSIIAPKMTKKVELAVTSPKRDEMELLKDSVWRDIAARIYEESLKVRSVITFVEGRKFAEQLASFMSELGGEDFARVHHGSLSKEQRHIVEQDLKQGRLRLLIATSSMELGIDVGEIDQVFQVGLPRTISGTMQRLGRAGHSPTKTSVMQIFPRTSEEALYCGMTAEVARNGGIEHSKPPRLCLDILAQHLVSMAANEEYEVEEVMPILKRAYPFREVTIEDVRGVLRMLAGDYEHDENVPVRPRLLYDRIHDHVEGDAYSRMLAVSAGGTIPDRGMFAVKTEAGVKIGEVEEEFVFESRVGDDFMLGSFSWKVQKITKDTVFVIPSQTRRSRLPFWKGEITGRNLMTGISFGKILQNLNQAANTDTLESELAKLGLDETCVEESADYVRRQIQSTEVLPSDETIIIEHYKDETGNYQMMIHSVFGAKVNMPIALLLQDHATTITQRTINYVADDDGIVLFPYDGKRLPTGLLQQLVPDTAKQLLEAMVQGTPTFNIVFRYNAGRALMMGARKFQRQPLWVQRVRGAQMLDSVIRYEEHPLIRETRRECLEDYWDIDGVIQVLQWIQSGKIQIRELFLELPSPMSFILRKKTEESLMYNYSPTPTGIIRATENKLSEIKNLITPDAFQLDRVQERRKLPEDEKQLHSLLMMEGDLIAGELEFPVDWLETLLRREQVTYIEPGLWIAAEQMELYEKALVNEDFDARKKIVLRLLRYRGTHTIQELAGRYLWTNDEAKSILEALLEENQLIFYQDAYYHKELFDRARNETIKSRRECVKTQPFANFVSWQLSQLTVVGTPMEQLQEAMKQLCKQPYPAVLWESVLLPSRVSGYRGDLLDKLLSYGEYYWRMSETGDLSFERYEEADWEVPIQELFEDHEEREKAVCEVIKRRGACFMNLFAQAVDGEIPYEELLSLASKGIVCADSFEPIRYYLNRESIQKMVLKQQIGARAKLLSSGRWDFARPTKAMSLEQQVEWALLRTGILCRETAKGLISWQLALEVLRIWEYTGKVRRGYFIEGLSGIQFIHGENYLLLTNELQHPRKEITWVSAIDPIQPWGKLTPHQEGRAFLNIAGTYVALSQGIPVVVFERSGKVLRCFDESFLPEALQSFAKGFQRKTIYPNSKRIVVKEYPEMAIPHLSQAGFHKEMMDYVLYR